jgi:hypothetical protein
MSEFSMERGGEGGAGNQSLIVKRFNKASWKWGVKGSVHHWNLKAKAHLAIPSDCKPTFC